jgi:hypothetical protein
MLPIILMGSGTLQLMSYGVQDMYIIKQPTITFFKIVYKRHTNFASESMPQYFNSKPDFGKKVSCTLNNLGDLINGTFIVVEIPAVAKFMDIVNEEGSGNSNIAVMAWCEKLGYKIIKSVSLEIGEKIIDEHSFDWFNVWNELQMHASKRSGLDKLIGNVPELTSLTSSKNGYSLKIPLIFWFNRFPNLALPMASLYNSPVKINVEFSSLYDCMIVGPSHYFTVKNDICLFEKGDLLYQSVNNVVNKFKFIYFDNLNKRCYYIKITPEAMTSTNNVYCESNNSYCVTPVKITGTTKIESLYFNKTKYFTQLNNLTIKSSYLLVDYIFIEKDELLKFKTKRMEYVIDTLEYGGNQTLYHSNSTIKVNYAKPCKELLFNCAYEHIQHGYIKDTFNYTTSLQRKSNIFKQVSIFMNGQYRLKPQPIEFYDQVQPFLYHTNNPTLGTGIYTFNILPEAYQPAGHCNFRKIKNIELHLVIDKGVSHSRPVNLHVYSRAIDLMIIENGLCEIYKP